MLRVSSFPAFVEPECSFAMCVALGLQTLFAHSHRDLLHLRVELFNTGGKFLQMQMSLVVDHLCLVEDTGHVALQLVVLVDFAVTEFDDGL